MATIIDEDCCCRSDELSLQLARAAERQELVCELLRAALEPLPGEQLMQTMLTRLLDSDQLASITTGAIFAADQARRLLRRVAMYGPPASGAAPCSEIAFGRCLCGQAAASGESIFTTSMDHRHDVDVPGATDHGQCCVPIRIADDVLGVLNVYVEAGHAVDPDVQKLLQAAADVLAGVMHRDRAKNDAADRCQQNARRLDRVLESSGISTWDWDLRTGHVVFDATWPRRLGYGPDKIPSTIEGWTGLVHPDDRESAGALIREVLCDRANEPELEYRIRSGSGEWRWFLARGSILDRDDDGRAVRAGGTHLDITERRERTQKMRRLATAVDQATETIVVTDLEGRIEYANPAFERVTGYAREDVIGLTPRVLRSGKHDRAFYDELWSTVTRGRVWHGHFFNRRKDGTLYEEEATISPVRDDRGTITHFVAVKRDVTEQQALQQQLGQAQKLEAVGQLAAGIAHEINTPTQYVGDNLRFLQGAFDDLLDPLRSLQTIVGSTNEGGVAPELLQQASEAIEKADLEYLQEELPRAVTQSLNGVESVRRIVHAMKQFSHPGTDKKTPCDLNESIRNAVTVSRNEWKYGAEIELNLDDALPLVPCLIGPFNQVMLNMIVNAAHAIDAVVDRDAAEKGTITIATEVKSDQAQIRVSDTGCGIEAKHLQRIFEPFFTTKAVGKGTGQGLSIVHSVIAGRHGGTIEVESVRGTGSTFTIRLPLTDPETASESQGDPR